MKRFVRATDRLPNPVECQRKDSELCSSSEGADSSGEGAHSYFGYNEKSLRSQVPLC